MYVVGCVLILWMGMDLAYMYIYIQCILILVMCEVDGKTCNSNSTMCMYYVIKTLMNVMIIIYVICFNRI